MQNIFYLTSINWRSDKLFLEDKLYIYRKKIQFYHYYRNIKSHQLIIPQQTFLYKFTRNVPRSNFYRI